MSLRRLFFEQFPDWMRPGHAVLRYVLQHERGQQSGLTRWLSQLVIALTVGGLLAISIVGYRAGNPMGMSEPAGSSVFTVLYFPLVMLQLVALVFALLNGASLFSAEHDRGTWEEFKITSHGAEMLVRARWAAVFYQMRGMLALLLAARLVFAGLVLVHLTDYQGYHLDLYITEITPHVGIEAAILLLAAFLTAALLQVFVMVGVSAALGLWISALVQRRKAAPFIRLILLVFLLAVFVFAMTSGARVLDETPGTPAYSSNMTSRWAGVFALGTVGDQGLRFMDLDTYLRVWTEVDYGIMLGAALLAVVVVEVVLTNGMLKLAARWASRAAKQ